jgi:hypothetical protein
MQDTFNNNNNKKQNLQSRKEFLTGTNNTWPFYDSKNCGIKEQTVSQKKTLKKSSLSMSLRSQAMKRYMHSKSER